MRKHFTFIKGINDLEEPRTLFRIEVSKDLQKLVFPVVLEGTRFKMTSHPEWVLFQSFEDIYLVHFTGKILEARDALRAYIDYDIVQSSDFIEDLTVVLNADGAAEYVSRRHCLKTMPGKCLYRVETASNEKSNWYSYIKTNYDNWAFLAIPDDDQPQLWSISPMKELKPRPAFGTTINLGSSEAFYLSYRNKPSKLMYKKHFFSRDQLVRLLGVNKNEPIPSSFILKRNTSQLLDREILRMTKRSLKI